MRKFVVLFGLILAFASCKKELEHPRIYITDAGKTAFTEKLDKTEWARASYESIKNGVEKYVDRHVTDPEWIISRMQMYWDTHHERIYTIGDDFSHGTGRAPVPTVKFQGSRNWVTDYAMPSLEETQPYMDEKGMYLQNMKKEGHPWEWVHPSKTGRMIGPMNDRIMSLAADAAFLYWYTGEDKYAVFASDIFMTFVRGIHYRREPFVLEQYGNSHILGLTTFEVILEGSIPHLAISYDFLHGYLKQEKEDFGMIASVFKRFAEQEIKYGVPDNNWNIFQARYVTYLALALESDSYYEDGKGRQYYINEILNHSTIHQFALKEAVGDIFDPETGIWPESATYSMSVCKDMLDIVSLIDNAENNRMLDTFAILKKAVPATTEYLFPNGRVTAFGDAKYVPLRAQPFEMLISLYRKYGDTEREKELTRVLRKLIEDKFYSRNEKSMFALFFYVDELMDIPAEEVSYDASTSNTFYAPNVSWLMQRNGKDPEEGMAFTLVGSYGNHAQTNGVSLEMYAKGLILAPESSYGASYGSIDNNEYYARFPAHNTVCVDGISEYGYMRSNYPYELKACYPSHADKGPIVGNLTFARVAFTEPKTDARQERLTGTVRLDEQSAYLVDIFRSARKDGNDKKHEYFYHSVGQGLEVMNAAGNKLSLSPTRELSSEAGDMNGYNYFEHKKAVAYDKDFKTRFNIALEQQEDVTVDMWMKGYPGRTVFNVMSPKSNAFEKGSCPEELLEKPLPTLIVRQTGEAWNRPFVAVYHPYTVAEGSSIQSIDYFGSTDDFVGITVHTENRTDYIFNCASGETDITHRDMQFKGAYAVVSESGNILENLFLSDGSKLAWKKWSLLSEQPTIQAVLAREDASYELTTSGEVTLTLPVEGTRPPQVSALNKSDPKLQGMVNGDVFIIRIPVGKYRIDF